MGAGADVPLEALERLLHHYQGEQQQHLTPSPDGLEVPFVTA